VRSALAVGADAVLTTATDAVRIAAAPVGLPFRVMESAARIDDETWLRGRLVQLGRERLPGAA
jgi:hypothetical protein